MIQISGFYQENSITNEFSEETSSLLSSYHLQCLNMDLPPNTHVEKFMLFTSGNIPKNMEMLFLSPNQTFQENSHQSIFNLHRFNIHVMCQDYQEFNKISAEEIEKVDWLSKDKVYSGQGNVLQFLTVNTLKQSNPQEDAVFLAGALLRDLSLLYADEFGMETVCAATRTIDYNIEDSQASLYKGYEFKTKNDPIGNLSKTNTNPKIDTKPFQHYLIEISPKIDHRCFQFVVKDLHSFQPNDFNRESQSICHSALSTNFNDINELSEFDQVSKSLLVDLSSFDVDVSAWISDRKLKLKKASQLQPKDFDPGPHTNQTTFFNLSLRNNSNNFSNNNNKWNERNYDRSPKNNDNVLNKVSENGELYNTGTIGSIGDLHINSFEKNGFTESAESFIHRGCQSTIIIIPHCKKNSEYMSESSYEERHCNYVDIEHAQYLT